MFFKSPFGEGLGVFLKIYFICFIYQTPSFHFKNQNGANSFCRKRIRA